MHLFLLVISLISIGVSIALNVYDKGPSGKNVMNTVLTYEPDNGLSSGYCSTESEINVD